jgi:uncharacterized spore protein YtfJ
MELQTFFQTLNDKLLNKALVSTVYGEPIIVGEKKVVPVARVACGFGGGAGTSTLQRGNSDAPKAGGEGGGGGGGLVAMPVGVVEVTPQATRFIRFGSTRRVFGALAVGILFGVVAGRRRLRR